MERDRLEKSFNQAAKEANDEIQKVEELISGFSVKNLLTYASLVTLLAKPALDQIKFGFDKFNTIAQKCSNVLVLAQQSNEEKKMVVAQNLIFKLVDLFLKIGNIAVDHFFDKLSSGDKAQFLTILHDGASRSTEFLNKLYEAGLLQSMQLDFDAIGKKAQAVDAFITSVNARKQG
jgi:hypothetical protein